MSKSKKRNTCTGQQCRYKIIPQSAYEERHVFKAGALTAALGLSLSAIIATMPQTVCYGKAVEIDSSAAAAYIQEVTEISYVSDFYTNEELVTFDVPELEDENEIFDEVVIALEDAEQLSGHTSSLSTEDAEAILAKIEAEKAAEKAKEEAAKKISSVRASTSKTTSSSSTKTTSSGYVRLNSKGLAMSQKTPPSWLTLDENGIPTSYKYCIKGKSTAYNGGTRTATGTRPMQGTVAVDPKEIPYGTKMYITSSDGRYIYGYAVAEDTGGFAKWKNGATVDLYMNSYSDACSWGWRSVNIYILD